VATITQPDGSTVTTAYSGNCTTVTDEAGKKRQSCSDGLGRLTGVYEDPSALNYETDYSYDTLDNLGGVTQKGGSTSGNYRSRSFVYDSLSRLTSATNPESGNITYTYDSDGNVLSRTAPKPNQTGTATVVTTYGYDQLHRLQNTWYNDGTQNEDHRYDGTTEWGATITNGVGHVTLESGAGGTLGSGYSYDAMGRVIFSFVQPPGLGSKYMYFGYYKDGELNTLTYPSGRVLTYTVNSAGREVSATDNVGVNYIKSATYAAHGEIASMVSGYETGFAGITTTNSYNSRLQPSTLSAAAPAGTVFSVTYDFHAGSGDNGNVWKITNNLDSTRPVIGTVSYGYDALNRISSASTSGTDCTVEVNGLTKNWGENYSIDAWGNLNTISPSKCSAEGLSLSSSVKNQINGDCYDSAGNLQGGSCSSPTYVYDGANRLSSTAGYTYSYDPGGRRMKKANGSTGTAYFFDPSSNVLAESDLSGNIQNEYIFFVGKRVARRDSSGYAHYYFSDHLGSSSVITNDLGVVEEEEDFYPYGGSRHIINNAAQHYHFAGKERDGESNLDYLGARFYSSAYGRFFVPDPTQLKRSRLSDPQRLNLYAYAVSNPLSFVDPDGRDAIAISFQDARYHGAGAIFGNKWWSFGHAGIVTVDSKGHAVYFDKNQSGVHKEDLGMVKLDQRGIVASTDLAKVLQKLSKEHGEGGAEKFAYFRADDASVGAINGDATKRAESHDKYDPGTANCAEFVEDELRVGGLVTDATNASPNGMFHEIENSALFTSTLQNATENSTHSLAEEMKELVEKVEP
jgi:RHS repeat-associated protein